MRRSAPSPRRTRDNRRTPPPLAEFFHATTCKRILPRAEAARQVPTWSVVSPLTPGAGTAALLAALEAAVAGRMQFHDALLPATARDAGCGAAILQDMGVPTHVDGIKAVPAFDRRGNVSAAPRAML